MVLFFNICIITQITRATPAVGQTILGIKTHIRGSYQEATWKKEKIKVDLFLIDIHLFYNMHITFVIYIYKALCLYSVRILSVRHVLKIP